MIPPPLTLTKEIKKIWSFPYICKHSKLANTTCGFKVDPIGLTHLDLTEEILLKFHIHFLSTRPT